MRPNLSVEKIAGALAVLGTTALMTACGGETKPPVNANEVTPSAEKASGAEGASHCGADKAHEPGQASCGGAKTDVAPADPTGAATPAAADAKPATETATPAEPTSDKPTETSAKPADAKAPAAAPSATTKKAAPAKAPAAKAPAKKSGGSSCGAGTCSTKK
jgi:hypothetical protein